MKKILITFILILIFSCSNKNSNPKKLAEEFLIALKNDDLNSINKLCWSIDDMIKTIENSSYSKEKILNKVKGYEESREYLKNSNEKRITLRDFINTREKLIKKIDGSLNDYDLLECYVGVADRNGISQGSIILKINNQSDNQFIKCEVIKIFNGEWKLAESIELAYESEIDRYNYMKYNYYKTFNDK